MQIQPIHHSFIMPTKGSEGAGAFDIYMPEAGNADGITKCVNLGFAAAVPQGHVALLLPRSSTGAKKSLELNNTCGVIDSDYRGEWKAFLKTKDGSFFSWAQGERILQFMVIPVAQLTLERVEQLDSTSRGEGGFGSTSV